MKTMKRNALLLALTMLGLVATAQSVREIQRLDDGWKFAFGHAAEPAKDFGCGTEYFNYLTKANYFSLRNITLGYTLPKKWLTPAGISNVRVYLTGDNIWLLSKRKGFDPRYSFDGYNEYAGYSALSSYSIGLNVSF
jgi:hypothetical protein